MQSQEALKAGKETVKKEKEPLTANEYRKRAEDHRGALTAGWKIFLKTGVFFTAAVCVIVGIGLAWFVNNKEVQTDGMMVQAVLNGDFELAAAGTIADAGAWDQDMLSAIGIGNQETISGGQYVTTAADKSSIRWAITESSQMENRQKTGISPGSAGKITFYIVAKKNGSLTVTLDVALTGAAKSTETELPRDALEILKGHILLFAGYDADSQAYSGWVSEDAKPWVMPLSYAEIGAGADLYAELERTESGSLVWKAENVKKDTAYPITLYWIWPEVVGEYLFCNLRDTGNRPLLFAADPTEENPKDPKALPESLFDKMCQADEDELSNRYFKWASVNDTASRDREEFIGFATAEKLRGLRNGSFDVLTYGKLCEYYNRADQYLGESIRYLNLCVDAR